jgi:hypothetical protein
MTRLDDSHCREALNTLSDVPFFGCARNALLALMTHEVKLA